MEPRATDGVLYAPPLRRRSVDNGALGMALFVFAEIMLFAGFISAFVIVESSALPGAWPPPDQPRLPFARTALNTVALLASGVALAVAGRRFRVHGPRSARTWMWAALLLGAAFVIAQGMEWVALVREGLTVTSSQLGSFFYVIVGTHALHATAALGALAVCAQRMARGTLSASVFGTTRLFWYFVVLVWPALYLVVYL